MSFNSANRTFDSSVITQLDSLLLIPDYPNGYEYLSDVLKQIDPGTNEPYIKADPEIHKSQLFLDQASSANEGVGAFSTWIRAYTNKQGDLRYESEFTITEMQNASDAVADSILTEVATTTILPDIEDIANFDALEIRNELFPDLGDNNPAWSGVVLYLAFDSNQLGRLDEGSLTPTFGNWWFAGLSTAVATAAAIGETIADPTEFCNEDRATIDGLRDLWQSLSGLDPEDLIDTSAVTPIAFGGTLISFEDAFDDILEGFEAATPRFKIAVGQLLTGGLGDLAETLCGADADERIQGNGGADLIFAGGGNDTVEGGEGDDVVTGSLGHDDVFGEAGSNVLHGGEGADYLVGGAGGDVLSGGAGADIIEGVDWSVTPEGLYTIEGGPGDDFIVTANLAGQFSGDQVVTGTTVVFTAEAGRDVVNATIGDVIRFKDLSPDDLEITLASFKPENVLEFYPVLFEVGDASLYAPFGLPAGTGSDPGVRIAFGEVPDNPEWTVSDLPDEIDHLVPDEDAIPENYRNAEDRFDEERALSDDPDPSDNGTDSGDSLVGSASADVIIAYAGADTVGGMAGDDMIGGAGLDVLDGGDGDNIFLVGDSDLDVYRGGGTLRFLPGVTVPMLASDFNWLDVSLSEIDGTQASSSVLRGPDSQIALDWDFSGIELTGIAALAGGDADDIIVGSFVDDEIWGGEGIDTLRGDAGDDELHGHGGDDELHGDRHAARVRRRRCDPWRGRRRPPLRQWQQRPVVRPCRQRPDRGRPG
jgi:Ca2+-binding RTX toxin-like protein